MSFQLYSGGLFRHTVEKGKKEKIKIKTKDSQPGGDKEEDRKIHTGSRRRDTLNTSKFTSSAFFLNSLSLHNLRLCRMEAEIPAPNHHPEHCKSVYTRKQACSS